MVIWRTCIKCKRTQRIIEFKVESKRRGRTCLACARMYERERAYKEFMDNVQAAAKQAEERLSRESDAVDKLLESVKDRLVTPDRPVLR